MRTLFIDECGYTGQDMLSKDQPIFTLACICLSEEECKKIKEKHFSKVKSSELKHSILSRRKSQRSMIINFLKDLSTNNQSVKFSISHKEYVLVSKIVDLIIEPMAYDDGIDFYANGLNIAVSNMIFYLTKKYAGIKFFKTMLLNFQEMIRNQTRDTYNNFFKMFFDRDFPKYLDDFYCLIRAAHFRYGLTMIESIPNDSLDITICNTLQLVNLFSKEFSDNILLIHDRSSKLAQDKKFWDYITSPSITTEKVGYDRRVMTFPFRVEKTVMDDSEKWAGLQLVDILAGSMTRCLKWMYMGMSSDGYAEELSKLLPYSFGGHTILPSLDVTPEELGTIGDYYGDPIAHFIKLYRNVR